LIEQTVKNFLSWLILWGRR